MRIPIMRWMMRSHTIYIHVPSFAHETHIIEIHGFSCYLPSKIPMILTKWSLTFSSNVFPAKNQDLGAWQERNHRETGNIAEKKRCKNGGNEHINLGNK